MSGFSNLTVGRTMSSGCARRCRQRRRRSSSTPSRPTHHSMSRSKRHRQRRTRRRSMPWYVAAHELICAVPSFLSLITPPSITHTAPSPSKHLSLAPTPVAPVADGTGKPGGASEAAAGEAQGQGGARPPGPREEAPAAGPGRPARGRTVAWLRRLSAASAMDKPPTTAHHCPARPATFVASALLLRAA